MNDEPVLDQGSPEAKAADVNDIDVTKEFEHNTKPKPKPPKPKLRGNGNSQEVIDMMAGNSSLIVINCFNNHVFLKFK